MFRRNLILIWCGLLCNAPLIADAQVARPDKRLQEKVSIQVEAKSVVELLQELGEKHKLPVDFDPSIKEEGIEGSFTLTADGLTLGSLIHLVCESENLVTSFDKGRLLVTTQVADSENLVVRDYPLAAFGGVDPRVLSIGLVELTSGFWMDIDGEGGEFVAMTPQALRIRQTRAVHDELQSLFDQVAAATGGRGRVLTAQGKAEQVMIRKLQTPAQFSTDKTALPELLDQLLQKNGIPLWVDQTALADEGIDWTKLESTVAVKKLSPAARLDAIVTEHKLAWRFADEVVQITTEAKSNERMFTRVYDIRRSNQPGPVLAQQLVQNPDLGPWVVNDGEGGGILPVGTLLLVRQNAKVHTLIAKLLN